MSKKFIKAVIVVDDDGNKIDILYKCDKEKNFECGKKYCNECNYTKDIKYAERMDNL